MALAPKRPEGFLALGDYYSQVRSEPGLALEQYAQGQQLAPKDARLLTAAAFSEMRLGRWEASLRHLREAGVLDPRSVNSAWHLTWALIALRRYPEALAAGNRAVSLAPTNLQVLLLTAMVYLAQGDLAGARAVLRAVPREVDQAALVAYIATYVDLYWVLDDQQQRLLLRLSPEPFGNNRSSWGLALAETHALRGDPYKARVYADSARLALKPELRDAPHEAPIHALLGVMLAYLGRKAEAIREGERGRDLKPVAKDALAGPYNQLQLVRIYLLAGEPEKALDQLEPLLKIPYYLSPGWLRIDPTFAPLKGNPRFEQLVAGK